MNLRIGKSVPEFAAPAYDRTKNDTEEQFTTVRLSDFQGQWVCLFFYPLDFTFVCPTEIVAFNEAFDEFAEHNCAVLTASTDSVYSHKGWCDTTPPLADLRYPMLADTTHRLSEMFGVLDPETGTAHRGVYLIDPEGVLRWMAVHDPNVGRNVDEVLRVLAALQTDELIPCNWKPGAKTLSS